MKSSLLFICLLAMLLCKAQKKTDSLFADYDLFALQGLQYTPAYNPDSMLLAVKTTRSATGKLKTLEVVSFEDEKLQSRKATVQYTPLGAIIGFRTLKTDGWEKVIIFGQKYFYHDSILIRNDTILCKSLYEESVTLQIIPPVKNDTLIIREVYKSYRAPGKYPQNDPWINLVNYKQWYRTNNSDKVRTYTLVKKDYYYELVKVNTDETSISEYDYTTLQSFYRRVGLSPFWIAIKSNLNWP